MCRICRSIGTCKETRKSKAVCLCLSVCVCVFMRAFTCVLLSERERVERCAFTELFRIVEKRPAVAGIAFVGREGNVIILFVFCVLYF